MFDLNTLYMVVEFGGRMDEIQIILINECHFKKHIFFPTISAMLKNSIHRPTNN